MTLTLTLRPRPFDDAQESFVKPFQAVTFDLETPCRTPGGPPPRFLISFNSDDDQDSKGSAEIPDAFLQANPFNLHFFGGIGWGSDNVFILGGVLVATCEQLDGERSFDEDNFKGGFMIRKTVGGPIELNVFSDLLSALSIDETTVFDKFYLNAIPALTYGTDFDRMETNDGPFIDVARSDPVKLADDLKFRPFADAAIAPPVAMDDSFAAIARGRVVLDLLANDTAPAGSVLSVVSVSDPALGSVVTRKDGQLAFLTRSDFDDLALGATDFTSITYTVADQFGVTSTATATIEVTGLGFETQTGLDGADMLDGTGAADLIFGERGNDTISGFNGADQLFGGSDDDALLGGRGNDVLRGNGGNDDLSGGVGQDRLLGGEGDDVLFGGLNEDVLLGGGGNDVLRGNGGNDNLSGGDGQDRLLGGADDDVLRGGLGDDVLLGSFGDDVLRGNGGNDYLSGGTRQDKLIGGEGDDVLSGGDGQDRLIGGTGADEMTGGAGDDIFVFQDASDSPAGSNCDTITDFGNGRDRLDFRQIDAVASGADDTFRFIGEAAFSGTASELRFFAKGSNTILSGDIDADGLADLEIALDGTLILTQNDFLL